MIDFLIGAFLVVAILYVLFVVVIGVVLIWRAFRGNDDDRDA